MLAHTRNKVLTGDCDCCPKTEQTLTERNGMKMCPSCLAQDDAAVARQSSIQVIESAHKIDAAIELKSDIFNSATVSFVELQAAIQNNPDIPTDEKEYALVKEAAIRRAKMQQTILAIKAELVTAQNEHFAWDKNIKDTVVKLRADYRTKFQQFDLQYQPVTPKSVKSPKSSAPSSKKYNREEVNNAAVKYGVPTSAIQMMLTSRHGLTAEMAAKEYAELTGLLKKAGE